MVQPPVTAPQPSLHGNRLHNRWQPRRHNTGAESKFRCSCPNSLPWLRNPLHSRKYSPYNIGNLHRNRFLSGLLHNRKTSSSINRYRCRNRNWRTIAGCNNRLRHGMQRCRRLQCITSTRITRDDRELLREDPYAEYPDFSEGMPHDGYGTNGYGILLNPIKKNNMALEIKGLQSIQIQKGLHGARVG